MSPADTIVGTTRAAAPSHASSRRVLPAAVLATIAGVLLLLDAPFWVFSVGVDSDLSARAQIAFPPLLLLSGLAALCAARIVRAAPHWAALCAAAAIVPVTIVHLAPTLTALSAPQLNWGPSPEPALGDFKLPLLTWLVIVTLLVASILFALMQPRLSRAQSQGTWRQTSGVGADVRVERGVASRRASWVRR
jgi:hypothetical protein